MSDTFPLPLIRPVQHGSTTITELVFREPNGGDICLSGHPFKVAKPSDGPPVTSFDATAITNLIAGLTGNPPSVIKQLGLTDWQRAMEVVAGFFSPMAEVTPTPDTV